MPRLIRGPQSSAAPSAFTLPQNQAFVPESVTASFDGSGAAGAFLPTLSIYAQSGELLARCPAPEVAAGDSAEVTFAPLLRAAAAAAATSAFTQIARTEFAVTGVFDFTAIPQTFNHLLLIVVGKIDWSDEVDGIRFNGDAGANYEAAGLEANDNVGIAQLSFPLEARAPIGTFAGNVGVGNVAAAASAYSVWIPEYRGTTFHKAVISQGGYILSPIAPAMASDSDTVYARWKSTAAITRITWDGSGGLLPGSTATLYGID